MANKYKDIDDRLKEIKDYAIVLRKASRWSNSNETIAHIQTSNNEETKREYIYEFYCYLRILKDLKANYDLELVSGEKHGVLFPKAPGLKKNYPYFSIKSKKSGKEEFQLCNGIKIKGKADEDSAPDISFLNRKTGKTPDFNDVFMIHDAKFKHNESKKIADSEFSKVSYMIRNLDCETPLGKSITFNEFINDIDINGNCILTNGFAFKTNTKHHKLFNIKEVEQFDIKKKPKVIG